MLYVRYIQSPAIRIETGHKDDICQLFCIIQCSLQCEVVLLFIILLSLLTLISFVHCPQEMSSLYIFSPRNQGVEKSLKVPSPPKKDKVRTAPWVPEPPIPGVPGQSSFQMLRSTVSINMHILGRLRIKPGFGTAMEKAASGYSLSSWRCHADLQLVFLTRMLMRTNKKRPYDM